MIRKVEITTAGKLRKALADVPDDTEIYSQVCGTDGTAWNLRSTISDVLSAIPRKLVISLRHPDLKTLPSNAFVYEEDENESNGN